MRLIDADVANRWMEQNEAYMDAEILRAIPTVDAVPVVHGRWIRPHWKNSNYCYDCSICGNEAMHREYRWSEKKIYPICPNCGAKMNEGANNA